MSEPIIISPKEPPPRATVEHVGSIIGHHLDKIVADGISLVLGSLTIVV